jgi:hypothetical protein
MVLDLVPEVVTNYITVITLLFTGIAVENYYVGRVTVFQNAVALLVYAGRFESAGLFFVVYLLLGLGVGAYGMWYYLRGDSLSDVYYDGVFYLYSSASVGMVILFTDVAELTVIWVVLGLVVGGFLNTWFYFRASEALAPISPESLSLARELSEWLFGQRL